MIDRIKISNLGPISELECSGLGNINLIIGPNQSGKTFLLDALFATMKTIETVHRGKENRSDKEILSDMLFWTFQTKSIGAIVRKRADSMHFEIKVRNEEFAYSVGARSEKQAKVEKNTFAPRSSNTVFIPAKEVLSIKDIILEAKDEKRFGFEEPYSDLARVVSRIPTRGKNRKDLSDARKQVEDMVNGHLEFDKEKNEWLFRGNDRRTYELSALSEGVKRLSVLYLLLGNHYIDSNSIIIIDELEANLHPSLIEGLLNMIVDLSKNGIQFFISSHSYFVIKRLYIIAHAQDMAVPVLSFDNGVCSISDLRDEMPKNPIIDESIKLYRDEIGL